jgi:hypothetical protein
MTPRMAAYKLVDVATDPRASTAARRAAWTGLLKFAGESIELDDLNERVERLERDADERKKEGGR